LADAGYAGLTMEAVARRARAGLDTVYRRWPSKRELLADALDLSVAEAVPVTDSGDIRTDLETMFAELCEYCARHGFNRVVAAVVGEAVADPWWSARLSAHLAQRRALTRPLVERAITAGQLRADTDPDLLLDLLNGVIWQRALLAQTPPDPGHAARIVDALLAGFTAPGRRPLLRALREPP
jgi:AcrR family transcriptional regulator